MRNIIITDGTNTVTLKNNLEFTITPKDIGPQTTMVSGKTVFDIVGVKNTLSIPAWLPAEDVVKLRAMIRTKHVLTVTYPSPEGDQTKLFLFEEPVWKPFRYGNSGVEIWYSTVLELTQQGVDT